MTAVVLAGGRGSRLEGRDKPLVEVAGRPLIQYILEKLRSQVRHVQINANRHLDRYRAFGVPVFSDDTEGFCGPLAGMQAALHRSETRHVLFLPGDAPVVDRRYGARMFEALNASGATACVAVSAGRWQPVHCILSRTLGAALDDAVRRGSSVEAWLREIGAATLDLSDSPGQFLNLNTWDDLPALEAALDEAHLETLDDREDADRSLRGNGR